MRAYRLTEQLLKLFLLENSLKMHQKQFVFTSFKIVFWDENVKESIDMLKYAAYNYWMVVELILS